MKRREFLQYGTLAATGFTVASCAKSGSNHFTQSAVNFGKLEKTDLKIGIVSSLDALPIVVAKEKGLFKKYGLNVTLVKQPTWEKLQSQLRLGEIDAAQSLFAMPLWEHYQQGGKNKQKSDEDKPRNRDKDKEGKDPVKTVALMGLNLNGNSISWNEAAWKGGLRPRWDYNNTQEMQAGYNKYIRESKEPLGFAIAHEAAMANYITRYWLGTIGIDADRHLKVQVLTPDAISAGLKSGKVAGYATEELFNQQAIADKLAFTSYIDRDIWSGHPEKILASLESWLKSNPNTARSVIAAVLEGCQYCEVAANIPTLAPMLSKSDYTDPVANKNWPQVLAGFYNYGGFDRKSRLNRVADFQIWHYPTDSTYLKAPNHANFLWHSHATWVLTQMVRWHQVNLYNYPKEATETIARLYPVAPYTDVAKAFGLALPNGQLKIEQPELFIDRMAFDPNKPEEYLNGFELRA
jgi:nitrate/nitrite transport system substrate-binding protein